jgi:hypothetical protein
MRAIWKFKLDAEAETVIKLPKSDQRHHFLHAGIDGMDGNPAVWVLIHKPDEDDPLSEPIGDDPLEVRVRTLPTGRLGPACNDLPRWHYLGTVHQNISRLTGPGHDHPTYTSHYVWHIFVEPGMAYKVGHGS